MSAPDKIKIKMLDKETYLTEQEKLRAAIMLGLAGVEANPSSSQAYSAAKLKTIVNNGLAPKYFEVGGTITVKRMTTLTIASSNDEVFVSVDEQAFIEGKSEALTKEYVFRYDGTNWKDENNVSVSLAGYGITIDSGTPVAGDEITVTEVAEDIVFDIAKCTEDEMILVAHECKCQMQFDNSESLFAGANGEQLPAGKYKFVYSGNALAFTATQPFYSVRFNDPPTSTSQKATTYGNDGRSIESNLVLSSDVSDADYDLGTYGSENAKCNSIDRMRYGSNDYLTSAIRQFINSKAGKGEWWEPKHKWDVGPGNRNTMAGYLHGMDPSFIAILDTPERIVKDNTTAWGGQGTRTYNTDKFYLLSNAEVNFNSDSDEGSPLPLFTDMGRLSKNDNSSEQNALRKKTDGTSYVNWWLQTAYRSNANNAHTVTSTGLRNRHNANDTYGVAPACRIKKASA